MNVTSALVRTGRNLRWFFRGVTGADAYERYCAHVRQHHPEDPLPDERQFWKDKWAEQDRSPKTRCC